MGEIKRYFRDKSWHIKAPRHLQELNWEASKAIETLTQELHRSPTMHEIAARIGASEEETIEALELGGVHEAVSLDAKLYMEGDASPHTHGEMVGGLDEELSKIEDFGDLKAAIENLEDRERAIILLRFFNELSQSEVAKRLNISQMHVSRLQAKALQRLKRMLADEETRSKGRAAPGKARAS
jgi:RNA polymerase sigma-B factor